MMACPPGAPAPVVGALATAELGAVVAAAAAAVGAAALGAAVAGVAGAAGPHASSREPTRAAPTLHSRNCRRVHLPACGVRTAMCALRRGLSSRPTSLYRPIVGCHCVANGDRARRVKPDGYDSDRPAIQKYGVMG